MSEKQREWILIACNSFEGNFRIPDEERDQMVVNVIESVLKKSIFDIPEEVLECIWDSLDTMVDFDVIHSRWKEYYESKTP